VDPVDCDFQSSRPWPSMDGFSNDTWAWAAPISTCTAAMFADGVVPDSKAMVFGTYLPLAYQANVSLCVIYYLAVGCVLYYTARGQGLLHDELFTELKMTTTQLIALLFWLLATFGAVLALAVMLAEWQTDEWQTDDIYQDIFGMVSDTIHICAIGGLAGIVGALWHDKIRAALGLGDAPSTERKVIVMSCPEEGTLDQFGEAPYDQKVMDKVMELQQRGIVKMGYDRAGTSTSVPEDVPLFESKEPAKIRQTKWFYGYRTSAKRVLQTESQGFDGQIEVICIEGGPITRVEAQEMAQIVEEAKADARMSGIKCRIKVIQLSYYDFLREYDADGPLEWVQ
jgi:hypothetical protein